LFLLSFMIRLWLAAAAALVMLCAPAALAQYPTKPIRLIVPYPPGAGTDFTARALGERITEALGQQVVIDSRPGAAATVGHGLVAKAAPDGYTLLLATTGGMVSAPALGMPIVYDPLKDFAYIGLTTYVPYSFVAFGGFPSNNMREFLSATGWNPPPPPPKACVTSSPPSCNCGAR
jgi:tripartite-type tricarboxylate transporter receptor subunit TctC